MPKPPVPAEFVAILAKPNPAVIATVKPDGSPVTVATWYLWDDGRVLLNMDESRKRLEYLRHDPRVSLTVLALDGADWGRTITLHGRVVSLADDPDLSGIDSLAQHYINQPYPMRDQRRVNGWLEIDSWATWGF